MKQVASLVPTLGNQTTLASSFQMPSLQASLTEAVALGSLGLEMPRWTST